MKLRIVYQDNNLIIIDKPAGLVVHEGAGETGETMVDLLFRDYPDIKKFKWNDNIRPGIVHRLDKDTSGLIIIAKDPVTQDFLQKQFQNREVEKTYLALVLGNVEPENGTIAIAIKRHSLHWRKMSVSYLGEGKIAKTSYKTINQYIFRNRNKNIVLTLMEIKPETGRMHQIRVHLKHKGWPVIGDLTYNTKESKQISKKLDINRQFLHAYKIKFKLPDGQPIEMKSELPENLVKIISKLEKK